MSEAIMEEEEEESGPTGDYAEGLPELAPLGVLKDYFFLDLDKIKPKAPDDNPVKLREMIIQGNMETGKTTSAKIMVDQTKKFYGMGRVNAVIAHTLSDAMKALNPKPVQLLVVDDPLKTKGMGYATFRTKQSYDNFDLLFEIRHKSREVSPDIKYVFLIVCTQRLFGGLDPNFRQAASVIGLKSLSMNPMDNHEIKKFLMDGKKDVEGKVAYQLLQKWDRWLYLHDKAKAKGFMIAVGRGGVKRVVRFKSSMIPQHSVWDTDNRPLYRLKLEEAMKFNPYRNMQIATLAMGWKYAKHMNPDTNREEFLEAMRVKQGLKFDTAFALGILRYVDEHPESTLIDTQMAFGCELPERYYRKLALEHLKMQSAKRLEEKTEDSLGSSDDEQYEELPEE